MNRIFFLLFATLIVIAVPSFGATPCCTVTSYDRATGRVTAVHLQTKQQFEFTVDPAEPAGIAAGARLDADIAAKKASLGGKTYAIAKIYSYPGAPCCLVTSIDARSGVITARDKTTGQVLKLKITNPALLGKLKPGQKLYANAARDAFSVESIAPCCGLIP